MSFANYSNQRSFGSLDGVRALSILAVVWHHSMARGNYRLPMLDRGYLGVDMFFVLSGFLIVTLILREHDRNGKISLRNFYARRTLRIFPVYYAVLAGLSLVFILRPDSSNASTFFSELPFYASYTSNWIDASTFALTWSLATEEQFYLFWPPVERFLKPLAIPILVAVIGFSQLINFGIFDSQLHSIFGVSPAAMPILQVTFTPICLGVLLAHMLHCQRGFQALFRLCGGRFAPLLGLAMIIALSNLPTSDFGGGYRLSVHLAMAYFLVAIVIREDHVLQRLLNIFPLKRIGTISYGMYLFHIFAVAAAMKLLQYLPFDGPVATFLIATVLTVIVAEISFRLFESPIMRWKRRFSS
jgi:peptidoglycan/LPS O-acetylase OafA/YrhL